jgi:voltage-gated potassium channel
VIRRRRDAKRAWLAERTLLGQLGRGDLDTLSASADRFTVPAGRVLIRRGDVGHEAFLVVSGRVEVRRGDELVVELGPGEIVGENALLGDRHRTADVVAVTEVEVAVFSRRGFGSALAGSPRSRPHVESTAGRRTPAA